MERKVKEEQRIEREWFPVPDYEGIYFIRRDGVCKSIYRKAAMTIRMTASGYPIYGFMKDGKHKNVYIHKLIATVFIPNPENKKQVNHINGIKTDNRIENLEWVTPSENFVHALKTGLNPSVGETHYRCKLTDADVVAIRQIDKSILNSVIAKQYGVSREQIRDIRNFKRRTIYINQKV